MKRFSRINALVILVLSLLAVTGCTSGSGGGDVTTAPEGPAVITTTAPEIAQEPSDTDLTLADSVRFDGTTVNVLVRTDFLNEFYVENMTADQLNDAIYNRHNDVEKRLGVDLNYITSPTGDSNATFHNRIRTSVNAGDKEFDLVAGYAYYLPSLASEGVFENWHNVEHIDFTRAWWGSRSNMAESLTINNKLFFISGDASLLYIQKAFGVFANTSLLKENNIDISNIYKEVTDGTWTLDKLAQYSSDLSRDLDGNGTYDDKDQYGFNLYLKTVADNFFYSFDSPIVTADNTGKLSLNMNNERLGNIVNKLHSLVYEGNRTYLTSSKGTSVSFFTNRHTAFTIGGLEWYPSFNEMTDDYGVLPYPKYDEKQEAYKTGVSDTFSLFAIPVTSEKISAVGATLEYMGYLSYRDVTPVYYEIVLKGKAARDSESYQMLDIIHDSISFDLGFIYSSALGNPAHMFRTLLGTSSSGNFASYIEKYGALYEKRLGELVTAYENLKD